MARTLNTCLTGRKPPRVLVIEDSQEDAELVIAELGRGGYDVVSQRVQTAETMKAALESATWDLLVSDYDMPSFTGPAALSLLKTTGQELPFVIISGTVGEEAAVAALKAGAQDFFVKNRLSRLNPAIARELADVAARRERDQVQAAVRRNEARKAA